MITNCYVCDKELKIKPYRIKRLKYNKITCSKICSNKTKETLYSGRNNPNTRYKNLDDNMFSKIDNLEKSYILGWIASDGSISKNNSITIAIHKKDIDCLFNLKELICKDISIKEKNETIVSITINSKQMAQDICSHLNITYGKKSHKVEVPKFKNKKLIWSFLRGFFDGDGSIPTPSKKHKIRCSITSNSKILLSQIENFVDLKTYNNKKDKIEFYGAQAIIFLKNIYKNSTPNTRLKRKYDSFKHLLSIF